MCKPIKNCSHPYARYCNRTKGPYCQAQVLLPLVSVEREEGDLREGLARHDLGVGVESAGVQGGVEHLEAHGAQAAERAAKDAS